MDQTAIRFGYGALSEMGHDAKALSVPRLAPFRDKVFAGLETMETAAGALSESGVDFDSYVSMVHGSVIDSRKAANLCATYPADFPA